MRRKYTLDQERQIIKLHEEHVPCKEISKRLGVNINKVKVIITKYWYNKMQQSKL